MVHTVAKKYLYKICKLLVLPVALAAAVLITPGHTFAQQGTEVTATICAAEGPVLQISSPQSDSVVNTQEVSLVGTAQRTSQIEVYVNEVYMQSTAIGTDGSINATIPLVLGTNTIKLVAYYSCNQLEYETKLVVSYTPDASSQSGRPSTRITRPGNTAPQQISNPEQSQSDKDLPIIERIKDNLRFDAHSSFVRPVVHWLALVVATLLLLLAIMAKRFWNKLLITIDSNAAYIKNYRRWRIFLRLLAAVLAIIFATIVQA